MDFDSQAETAQIEYKERAVGSKDDLCGADYIIIIIIVILLNQ